MAYLEPADTSRLPDPHASLAIIRITAQAFIKTMGRKKGERFIRELAVAISQEECVRLLLPARPPNQRAAQAKAQDEAAMWLRQILPVLLSAIPPDE